MAQISIIKNDQRIRQIEYHSPIIKYSNYYINLIKRSQPKPLFRVGKVENSRGN